MCNRGKQLILCGLLLSQAGAKDAIAVYVAEAVGLVDMETDAITALIEEELEATDVYFVMEGSGGDAPLSFQKQNRSGLGQITTNLWRARSDTLDPSVGDRLDNSEVLIWRLYRSGRTYEYDYRLYSVETDFSERYSSQGNQMNKRYLKGKARSTLRFTGTAENAAEAARLMAWHSVGLKPPKGRFSRDVRVGILAGLRRAYNTFWFVIDSGFESVLILAALLIMGGAASSIAADSGEDLGYPPDYPGVP